MSNIEAASGASTLELLLKQLRPVFSKRAGVALGLWGEAGIGKTHLTRQLLARVPCQSLSLPAALPLTQVPQRLPRPSRLPNWVDHLLERLAQGEGSEAAATADALAALLATLAPVILHLEDLHEASPEGHELWLALAQRASRTRGVALLATSRTKPPTPFKSQPLEPLSAEAARVLLEREAGTTLPQEAGSWIYAKALGNPLFTLEYFRYLSRRGYLWNDLSRWHWRAPEQGQLPTTIEVLIEKLLSDAVTSPEVKIALEARAILPAMVTEEVWAEVAGFPLETLNEQQRELERRGIMSGMMFKHPLLGEVAARGLSVLRKRDLARRAVAALGDDVQTAANFLADADLEAESALRLLRRATEDAQERHDLLRAAKLLSQMVRYASGASKAQLSLEAARALLDAGLSGAQPLLEDALPLLEDQSEGLLMLAEAYAVEGRPGKMEAVLARLPESVRQSPTWLERYLRLLFNSGASSEVLAVWRAHPEFHSEASTSSLYHVAYTLMDRGDLTSALALAEARLARGDLNSFDQAELLDICAAVSFYRGDYARAEALFGEALTCYQQHPKVWNAVANILRNRALNRLGLGQYRESLPDLRASLQLYAKRGRGIGYAQTLTMISDPLIELGEYEQAEEALREALDIFERVRPQPFLIICLANLVYLYLDWHPPYEPVQELLLCA